jgi:ABC-type antimicrobial peptide transport system permease subunit
MLVQFFTEGVLGPIFGCISAIPIAYLVLCLVDARVMQPLIFSPTAAFSEALGSIALYAAFALLSSLRAIQIQPMVALRSE